MSQISRQISLRRNTGDLEMDWAPTFDDFGYPCMMLKPLDDSPAHHISFKKGGWQIFPRFKDKDMETDYLMGVNGRNRSMLYKVWPTASGIVIVLFFAHGMRWQLAPSETEAIALGWSYAGALLSIQSAPALAFLARTSVDSSFLFSSILCSFVLQTGRWLFHLDCYGWRWQDGGDSCRGGTDGEATQIASDGELLLLYSLLICTMVLVFEPRSSLSWALPTAQVGWYGITTVLAGGAGRESLPESLCRVVLLGILGFVCCRTRFAAELRHRCMWADQCSIFLKARYRSERLSRRREDLEELDMQQDILHQPELEVDFIDHHSSTASSGKLPAGRMERTARNERAEEPMVPVLGCRSYSVPLPKLSPCALGDGKNVPNDLLASHMAQRTADKERIESMARRIREPDYTLDVFFADALAAFPELELFFVGGVGNSTSGCEAAKEYQRTIGALFAVYWMLRLDIDGKDGFCFGVDKKWVVRQSGDISDSAEDQQREAFLNAMDWSQFTEIVDMANLTCEDTVSAMLCLTAFHDVMKLEEICPVVQAEHAPYLGHAAGTTIHDHDQALSYVLEYYPQLLPSFAWLPEAAQRSILFSQSKLQFNHGWFVQAEAPPGAMLTTFKRTLQGANPGDLAFYFFHWLTDLAGAEGTPLAGAEKFTVKFPHTVLQAFLWSIPYLRHLEDCTETEVVQSYLEARWLSTFPERKLPEGHTSLAKLRLAVMAQSAAREAIDCFDLLPPESSELLSTELARTGMASQSYRCNPVAGGPAFLVYYGPAVLQRCHGDLERMRLALRALVAVFEAGRKLWPADILQQGSTVTLQVGKLKAHDVAHIFRCCPGETRCMWAMVQQSDTEAVCDLYGAPDLNKFNETGTRYCVLDLQQKLSSEEAIAFVRESTYEVSALSHDDFEAMLMAEACAEVPKDIDSDAEEYRRPQSLPRILGRHLTPPYKIKALRV